MLAPHEAEQITFQGEMHLVDRGVGAGDLELLNEVDRCGGRRLDPEEDIRASGRAEYRLDLVISGLDLDFSIPFLASPWSGEECRCFTFAAECNVKVGPLAFSSSGFAVSAGGVQGTAAFALGGAGTAASCGRRRAGSGGAGGWRRSEIRLGGGQAEPS